MPLCTFWGTSSALCMPRRRQAAKWGTRRTCAGVYPRWHDDMRGDAGGTEGAAHNLEGARSDVRHGGHARRVGQTPESGRVKD
jgi:hypothetical protein